MEENKIFCKPAYKCGICGKEYSTVQDRMNCEMTCVKLQQEEAKKAAEAKKDAERKADFEEASKAIDNAWRLVNKCIEKHGVFKYNGKLNNIDVFNMDFFPSKLLHYFL